MFPWVPFQEEVRPQAMRDADGPHSVHTATLAVCVALNLTVCRRYRGHGRLWHSGRGASSVSCVSPP
jgi:hypothetical protein